ncbi:hypothetical protein [Chitinophaga sp. CF418]|uniref:hypothetical protein n=1 Tax=Chitinophaga sp. CF418 TaxID=1855287 RepID=UPI00091EC38B|nr:hypothetical protein [Chitinophaga sp. CF418]SHN28260.1 hypothetical protein SAMN05216311_10881 [Chitinophaga sp. CF418]
MLVNRSNLSLNGVPLYSLIFEGASGSVGNITFSQRNGKTVAGRKRGPGTTPPTEKQIAVRERFKMASQQALLVLVDPARKAFYEAKKTRNGTGAYALALRDIYLSISVS